MTLKAFFIILYLLCACTQAHADCVAKKYVASDRQQTIFGIIFPKGSILKCRHNSVRNHITITLHISKKATLNPIQKTYTQNKFITHYEIKKHHNFHIIKIFINSHSKYIRTKCSSSFVNVYVKNNSNTRSILIDPGHGGRDPGSLSNDMIHEKGITIAFARFIKQELEKTGRYVVRLTRNGDITLSRAKRLAMIKKINPDAFISIHADNISNADISGISVYTLKSKKSCKNSNIEDDIFMKDVIISSVELADIFLKYIPDMFKLKKNSHRVGRMSILRNNTPSILVETGYISNAKDKLLLNSDIFREKLAQSLLYSLDEFFMKD